MPGKQACRQTGVLDVRVLDVDVVADGLCQRRHVPGVVAGKRRDRLRNPKLAKILAKGTLSEASAICLQMDEGGAIGGAGSSTGAIAPSYSRLQGSERVLVVGGNPKTAPQDRISDSSPVFVVAVRLIGWTVNGVV